MCTTITNYAVISVMMLFDLPWQPTNEPHRPLFQPDGKAYLLFSPEDLYILYPPNNTTLPH